MNDDDSSHCDVLGELLQSCASITNSSLSYRTLDPSANSSSISASIIAGEQSRWMDRQILDLQSRLPLDSTTTASTTKTPKELQRAIIEKQQELLDASVRQQQELLLLKGLESARGVPSLSDGSPRDVLLREALRSRNREVSKTLVLQRKLEEVRRRRRQAEENIQRQQQENRALWKQLLKSKPSVATEQTDVARENTVLKRVMTDLLAGSDLEWSQDDRLQEIMMRITKE